MDDRPPPKFKAGDKVKFRDIEGNKWLPQFQGACEVVDVSSVPNPYYNAEMRGMVYYYVKVKGWPRWFENRMEFAHPTTPIKLEDLI